MEAKWNGWKSITLTVLRAAIGWHFLYEGITKLFMSGWSSQSYLLNATGFMSGFYHWLGNSENLVGAVDILNIYGLIIIGLALFLGILVRFASVAGILLLLLYYFAYPPFGTSLFGSTEGHFYIVNRNFIEAVVLFWFVVSSRRGYGIDRLIGWFRKRNAEQRPETVQTAAQPAPGMETTTGNSSRREMLRNLATLPFLGALGWGAVSRTGKSVDVMSGATLQLNFTSLGELKGELPKGKIGDHEISRLVAGGNLIGGWAHSRDLMYVSSLFKAYNTEYKVYETLMLAEQAGINTINIGFISGTLLAKYKKATGSRIKVITQVGPDMEKEDYFGQLDRAIDEGADIIQIQGGSCDFLSRDKRFDVIQMMLERIREQGYTAGLGAHTVDTFIECEQKGILPDYYMKTMHHDHYWSAHPIENRVPYEVDASKSPDHNRFHDNLFCLFPERTIDFVNRTTLPVMGFKVLAAGAIEPADGFRWAFENGADFICVGMFDFQVVEDVNITIDVLNNLSGRKREWFG